MRTTHTWVIINSDRVYRVLAGFTRFGEPWRISSDIVHHAFIDGVNYFTTYTGQVYKCCPEDYRLDITTESIYNFYKNTYHYRLCDKDENWADLMNTKTELTTPELLNKIMLWHQERLLIQNSTDLSQFAKLVQEVGELSDNICKGNDLADDIGDIIVVLVNIATRNNLTIRECLQRAYDDIKDRKGHLTPEGVFIKHEA